jgi:hypothetical protein
MILISALTTRIRRIKALEIHIQDLEQRFSEEQNMRIVMSNKLEPLHRVYGDSAENMLDDHRTFDGSDQNC